MAESVAVAPAPSGEGESATDGGLLLRICKVTFLTQ